MPRQETITISNQVPDILAALTQHPDCPEWLRTDIFDAVNRRSSGEMTYSPIFWKAALETVEDVTDTLERELQILEQREGTANWRVN